MGREMIHIKDLTYSYPRSDAPSLRDISLEIEEGEIVTLMGHTGCGKSTLCLTLNGVIPHALRGTMSGSVVVDGLDTQEHGIPELASRVGMLFQDPETQLFSVTVESEVAFGPENLATPRDEIVERVRWAMKATRLDGFEHREPSNLSGGEKQLVALAAALAMRPKILVLDEPTSELDPAGTLRIFSLIRELNERYGITFLMVEHKEEAIKLSDRLFLMKDGEIICEGEPHDVLSDIDAVKAARIRVPQVSELFYRLRERGLDIDEVPITVEEGYELLQGILRGRRGV